MGRKSSSLEEFVKKANLVHGENYGYDESVYINSRTKIIINCSVHGNFNQLPATHLLGAGCKKCATETTKIKITSNTDDFIEKANIIHNFKYDYSNTDYINNYTKIKIRCPVHGEFIINPSNHLSGHGCKKCNHGSYTKESFINIANGKECVFYIVKCFNESEVFYKIGITTRTIKSRFYGQSVMPYNYTILKVVNGNADYVWELENKLKENLKFTYKPSIYFGGSSNECFLDYEEIENKLNVVLRRV